MSYLVLARKYRPQSFSDVVAQEHITQTLANAIVAGRVAHAILFTGPRGTGKTTVARILAKALNCQEGPAREPCNRCRSCEEITAGHCVDVFEIDGASNNSVDQVRELRENVKYMPAHSRYKIYIIDEVHMLSTPAFNALLKTLEEPPPHVLFMFATTEAHKIPITILSRCQRFDFRRIRLESVARYLATICGQEAVAISSESLDLIAREAGGSIRDSLSLLDQVMASGAKAIPHDRVVDTLGVIDRQQIHELAEALLTGNATRFIGALDEMFDRGHDVKKLFSDLLEYVRNLMVLHTSREAHKLVDLPASEIDLMQRQAQRFPQTSLHQILEILFREEPAVRLSPQPKLALEMAFFRVLQAQPTLSIDTLIQKLEELRREVGGPSAPSGNTPGNRPQPPSAALARPPSEGQGGRDASRPVPVDIPPPGSGTGRREFESLDAAWQRVIDIIARQQPSLVATLKKCSLRGADPGRLEIVPPANHYASGMLRRDKHLALLKQVCGDVFGDAVDIVIAAGGEGGLNSHEKRERNHTLVQQALNHPLIADAIEIFNGKLVDVQILPEVNK
ncbi:MAG TPA: DNA polymerase III subunit gamma/tau [Desulfobacterales bacterium]|nr:DNA polymerase III subunit gamma/tau [Desulfobacterales bacterium]